MATLSLFVTAFRPYWIVRHPLGVLGVVVALTLGSGQALVAMDPLGLRISIDPSTDPLLPLDDPSGPLYRRAVLDFGDDEIYAVVLDCGDVFEYSCLAALERASDRVARLDGVRSVSSLVDVTSFRWVESEDWIEIRPFIDRIPRDPLALADLRERALADPLYLGTLVDSEGRSAALNIRFQEMDDSDFIASHLDEKISDILEEEMAGVGDYHVAGRPHVKVHVYRGILRDLRLIVPIAMVVMAAVLWLCFRSWRGVLLPLGIAVLTQIWTFGAMAFFEQSLNLLTGSLSPMLLAISSVYGVHVVARYEEETITSTSPSQAALACLLQIRLPTLIAGLTTLIGFGALLISDIPAVLAFGIFAMLGVASATLLALTAIPASLAILPLPELASPSGNAAISGRPDGRGGVVDRFLVALAGAVARHSRPAILIWGGIAVASVLALPRIEVDTDYLSYFVAEDPVRRDFEVVNRRLSGVVPIYVVAEGRGPGSFRDPELLRALKALEESLAALPEVGRTVSFIDRLTRLNRVFHGDDPAEERIPDRRSAITELLFMLPKAELGRFLTVDHGRANIIIRTGQVGSAAILDLERRLQEIIDSESLPRGARVQITGNTLLLSHSADGIARGQLRSVGFAAVAILALISLGLRSIRLGVVAMLPNLLPVLIFFGLLGLGLAPLSLPVSLIGSMALGIAIDDSVHFLVRYRRERQGGGDPFEAALAASRRVGRPIVITSSMLCLGYGIVMASRFATLQEFGALSALTMLVCLATDLILLPAVLIRLRA